MENRDFVTLYIEQHGYSIGFAQCALRTTRHKDFLILASAFVLSNGYALLGAKGDHGMFVAADYAKARQAYSVAKWIFAEPSSDD
jgi:hypothetical protein